MSVKELYLHTSNRIESLAERLVQVSRTQPLESLLAQETVMTLNPGMARWLRFQIAQSQSVAFGWDFPFPGALFERILSGFDREHTQNGLFDENIARWELFDLLGKLENSEQFSLLRRYCDQSSARRLQLAAKLAWLYDQYLLYRPDTIIAWESGRDPGNWQGELWRRLLPRAFPGTRRPKHIARIWQDLRLSRPDRVKPNTRDWPERIALFGASSLPPLHLDLLDVVSRFRPVHIFLLQPSDLYWADLKSSKQIARTSQRIASETPQLDLDIEDLSFEIGNPLLPSFGKQGQAFLDLILDKDPIQDDAAFLAPVPKTQLSCLQSDLFALEGRSTNEIPQYPFPSYDGSIQTHKSSNPRREVESLWDYILDFFATNPDAQASDILVMAPDIQDYAGHIEAVFANGQNDEPAIPFSIADQSGVLESPFLSGTIEYLELPSKRATANEIFSLLKLPLTREAFDFSDSEIDRIEFWIRSIGVVWGWDSAHRQGFDAFPTQRNTWSEFRAKLAAGIAYRDESELIPGQLSPFCEIEGESAELAGRFIEFLGFLEELKNESNRTDTIAYWNHRLCSTLDRLKPNDEFEQNRFHSAIETLQKSLPERSSIIASGNEAFANAIQALQESSPSGGYLSGRVTFCSLKPMRSIPAKVICLLGMNSDRFPRKPIRAPFDLLALNPRRGDRNTRDEDKQFFLETLLSARERIFISYQGLSPVNDAEREPSIVVSELLDYLEIATSEEHAKFTVAHKRQSYDPEYFKGKRLFTYSATRATNCQASLERRAITKESRAEFSLNSETELPREQSKLTIDSLLRFFKDPQKFFVQNTLGVRFPTAEDTLPERDALQQNPLSRYQLFERFANAIRSNEPIESIDPAFIASLKLLPPGHLERLTYDALSEQATLIENSWRVDGMLEMGETLSIDLDIANFRLSGQMRRNALPGLQYLLHPGKWTAKARLEFWIRHLLANAIEAQTTRIFSLRETEHSIELPPVLNAVRLLEPLLDYYRQGLVQPIPFYPQLSWDALKSLDKSPNGNEASDPSFALIESSRGLLDKSPQSSAYAPKYPWDIYGQTCFGHAPILDESYAQVSRSIWTPYRDALKKEGVSR